MKNMKKLANLLLALVMVLSMATTAFAAGEGSITVENPIAGQTYTAYKIFDVVYNEDKTAYAYTISSTSEWYQTVSSYATEENGLTLTVSAADATVYIVETTSAFSPAAFAATLKTATTGKTGTALTVGEDGKAKAESLDLGYYFVTSSTGALCNLTTTNPTASIRDKNDVPFEKVDDKQDVEVGETVKYTITGKVPDTTGFTTYDYTIKDTMSDGLTFNKDVKVYIDGTEITSNFTLTYNADNQGFVLTIAVKELQTQVGKEIKVEYTATVNEKAVAQIENNKATLTYSNDPTDSEKKQTTPEDKETVYSSKLVIDKYETDKEDTKLAGAKFVLYKNVTTGEGENATTTKMYYKYTAPKAAEGENAAVAAKVEWVALGENETLESAIKAGKITEVTTDDKGAANFDGLKDGTYYLHETEAPAGYNMLKEDVTVTINGTDVTEADLSKLTATSKVGNNTGSELPETGGMGTTLFYTIGGLLMLAAVVLLVTKKRMGAAE